MLHISIKAESLFTIFGFTITNSYLATLIVLGLFYIVATSYHTAKTANKSNTFTVIIDFIQEKLYFYLKNIVHGKINILYPLLGSYFFFILCSNYLGLMPGFGSLLLKQDHGKPYVIALAGEVNAGAPQTEPVQQSDTKQVNSTKEEKHYDPHLLRAPTADLNTTIALGLISVFFIQYYGVTMAGASNYAKKFFNFTNPIKFFVGILEIISDFVKIFSFGFRLFGNVFAGEVVLMVVAFIVPYFASFPFLLFEFFAGFIQAVIFTTLSAVFLAQAAEAHH